MTDAEQREAARQFVNRWMGKGKEDEDGRSYWIDLLTNVLGMDNVTERLNFEKKVVIDGNTKRIDVYIPETRVIIEQKSLGKALDQKIRNSGDVDLTPFEQADRYNGKLTFDERARWIVTSNFAEIWIYDMNQKQPEPTKIALDELQSKYPLLDFLVKKEVKTISHEMEVSIKAGGIVGLIYDAFLKQYRIPDIKEKDETFEQKEKREHKLKSLNALCVRIVFCLYAEDAGIFGKRNMFHDYLETYEVKDCRRAIIELFKILDTPVSERDEYLEEELAQFPYVNGGLFADETIEIPPFTDEIRELLLEGLLDLGVVQIPYTGHGLVSQLLYDEYFQVVMKDPGRFRGKKELSVRELDARQEIFQSFTDGFRAWHDTHWRILDSKIRVNSTPTAEKYFQAPEDWMIVPCSVARAMTGRGFTAFPLKEVTPLHQVYLCWRQEEDRPHVMALLDALEEHFNP